MVLSSASTRGQTPPPALEQYRAALLAVKGEVPQWRELINGTKIEDLSVSYADGKMIAESKDHALYDLDQIQRDTDSVCRDGRLSDEVDLVFSIRELTNGLGNLSYSLALFVIQGLAARSPRWFAARVDFRDQGTKPGSRFLD